ncbi:hypothetical protein Y788_14455 [Pantoea dispersa 625]|nr:hypothetical protein Y788_14455 [Pantoea dispersa 625]
MSGFVRGLTWRGRDVMQDFAVMILATVGIPHNWLNT